MAPRWKIHQDSYIDTGNNGGGELVPAGQELDLHPRRAASGMPGKPGHQPELHHVPGPHWEPLNDEAKVIALKHKQVFTGEVPDVVEDMTRELEALQAKQREQDARHSNAMTPEQLAAVVAQTVAQVLDTREVAKAQAAKAKPADAKPGDAAGLV